MIRVAVTVKVTHFEYVFISQQKLPKNCQTTNKKFPANGLQKLPKKKIRFGRKTAKLATLVNDDGIDSFIMTLKE